MISRQVKKSNNPFRTIIQTQVIKYWCSTWHTTQNRCNVILHLNYRLLLGTQSTHKNVARDP